MRFVVGLAFGITVIPALLAVLRWMTVQVGANEAVVFAAAASSCERTNEPVSISSPGNSYRQSARTGSRCAESLLCFEEPFGARALGLWVEFHVVDALKYVGSAAVGRGGFADAVEQTLTAPKRQARDQALVAAHVERSVRDLACRWGIRVDRVIIRKGAGRARGASATAVSAQHAHAPHDLH